jgi:hypothetical protein
MSHSESQQEYNELLTMTQSLLGKIQNDLDSLNEATDGRNKKLSTQIDLTKDVIKGIHSEKDLQAAINLILQNNNNLNTKNFGVNQKLLKVFMAQTAALQGVLHKHEQAHKILDKVYSITDGVKGKFEDMFQGIHDGLHHLPLIGEYLAEAFHPLQEKMNRMFSVVAEKFKMGFGKAFTDSIAGGKSFATSIVSGIGGGFKKAYGAASRFAGLLGPIGIGIVAIAGALALSYHRFHEIEEAANQFKQTTGLATADMHELEHTVQGIANHYGKIGVSVADASQYMQDFTDNTDDLVIPLESTVASMAVLNKNFGVLSDEGAKVNKVFQNMAQLNETQAQFLVNSVTEMSNLAGVAPNKVIKDIAENAATSYKYFKGNPKELAKAAVYAAKMGASLEDMNKSTEKLLDFEQSMTDELEASALLGTNIDMSRARELGYAGDQLGMQKEITKQLANIGDINKLSAYEKEALVNLTGQELDSLVTQQRLYNRFGEMDEKRMQAANELLGAGLDINDISEEDLEKQTERLAKQEAMQDMMTQMGNRMSAMGGALLDIFTPVAQLFVTGLTAAVKVLSAVLIPTFQMLGKAVAIAFWPLNNAAHLFKELIGYVKEYYDYIIAAGVGAGIVTGILQRQIILENAKNAATFIGVQLSKEGWLFKTYETVATWATATAQSALNLVKMIGSSLGRKELMTEIALMATKAFNALGGLPVVGPVLGAAAAVAAYALGKSYFSKAGDVYSPADGKTQISTKEGGLFELSPNDDVLAGPGLGEAMKNKEGVSGIVATAGGEAGGAVAGMVNSMIAEIRGLRSDLASGKVAVYMDGRKVTAAVATKVNEDPTTTKR